MKTNTRPLRTIAALLAALLVGFLLAKLTDGMGSPHAGHDHHTAHDEDGAEQHAGPATKGEPGNHDDHDHAHDHGDDEAGHGHEEEEGLVVLTSRQIDASGIRVVAVGRGAGGGEARLNGRVEPAIGARAAVAASIGGRVEQILVSPGARVRAGEPLVVLVSGEAAAMRANADAARADAEAARHAYQRDQSLLAQGVIARQEFEASRARSLAADATARAAEAQARAAGAPDARGRITIDSPIPGLVGAVRATPGGFVNAGDLVANVVDSSQVELVFSAPASLAAHIVPESRIEVAGPDGSFEAVVTGVVADVREQGGRVIVRAQAESTPLPPAGTPVSGVLAAAGREQALTVPADAVQTVDGRSVVFVAEDGGFRAMPVLAGRRAGGRIEVLSGLSGDERIAGVNAFLLKAELAKGEAGHDH